MYQTFENALAPGTMKNRRHQAALYIKFMILYRFDFMNPSSVAIGMYSQFLNNSFAAPGKAKNHISGVKSWLNLHGGSTINFSSPEIGLMSKAFVEKSTYVPSPAPAINEGDI